MTIAATVSHDQICDQERDDLTFTLTGTRGTITATESKDACDGCLDWTTNSSSGTLCSEEEDTEVDTGTGR